MNTIQTSLTEQEIKRYNELTDQSYRKVFNMAYRLSGSRPDAEDLTQEAYLRAYRSFRDYEGDRPFENWIYRIVTRLYLDLLRNRRRRVQTVSFDSALPTDNGGGKLHFEIADTSKNPEDHLLDGVFSEPLYDAIMSLSPEQRHLIELADLLEVPYAEIAERLGAPVGTIRSRLHRAHKALKEKLSKSHASSALVGNRA